MNLASHLAFGGFLVAVAMFLTWRGAEERRRRGIRGDDDAEDIAAEDTIDGATDRVDAATSSAAAAASAARRERIYRAKQSRRRALVNAIIGSLGIAVAAGYWIQGPLSAALYWSGLAMAALVIILLAAVDSLTTHRHFRLARRDLALERSRLEFDLSAARRQQANRDRDNSD